MGLKNLIKETKLSNIKFISSVGYYKDLNRKKRYNSTVDTEKIYFGVLELTGEEIDYSKDEYFFNGVVIENNKQVFAEWIGTKRNIRIDVSK